MITEDFSIQHDQEYTEWQRQCNIPKGLRVIAWKMVQLALLDLRRKSDRWEYKTAHGWIFSEVDYFFCFKNICDLAGLNAVNIRRRVREYLSTGQKVPKIRTRERKPRKRKVE